ncbi:MAG: lipopolysaccharide biosynthesis protein [Ferruginibacter sp.]
MFRNIIWDYIGKFGNYLVIFLISIVLTRLLSPGEFGIMAMVVVVITVAGIFLDMGFNRAIIQQKEISTLQLSTIFYINLAASVILMLVCFFSAGPLAIFYKQPLIKPVFQVISLSFPLNSLDLIPTALIYKNLKLKANSIILLLSSSISGIIGIIMAYKGYGVWSLVMQSLLSSLIMLILDAWYIGWLPSRQFSFIAIKPLWHYGSRMFASGLLERIYTKLDSLIIGKLYSTATLGFYYRAQTVEGFVRTFSAGGILGTLFPFIAKHQDDRIYIKQIYQKYLHIISFVAVGLSALLFLTSRDVFIILFTNRWLYAADLFRLMILAGIVWPVSSLMVSIISGVGNSKNFLKLEVYKKIILLPVYIFGFFWGLNIFIISFVVASFICLFINMIFVNKEINFNPWEQSKTMLLYIAWGVAAAVASWGILYFLNFYSPVIRTIVYFGLFTSCYLGGSYLLKLQGLEIIDRIWLYFKKFKPTT